MEPTLSSDICLANERRRKSFGGMVWFLAPSVVLGPGPAKLDRGEYQLPKVVWIMLEVGW